MDGDSELSMFNKETNGNGNKEIMLDGADEILVAPPKSKNISKIKLSNLLKLRGVNPPVVQRQILIIYMRST